MLIYNPEDKTYSKFITIEEPKIKLILNLLPLKKWQKSKKKSNK